MKSPNLDKTLMDLQDFLKLDDKGVFHNDNFFFKTVYSGQIEQQNLEYLSAYSYNTETCGTTNFGPVAMEMQTIENLAKTVHVPGL